MSWLASAAGRLALAAGLGAVQAAHGIKIVGLGQVRLIQARPATISVRASWFAS